MPLTVTASLVSAKYSQLLIFDGQQQIGEYERSQKADIGRKKQEVLNAQADLRKIFQIHGPFVVRWSKGTKVIRNSRGVQVATVDREHWEKPSWQP